jgi:hypothetical protein
MWGWRPVRPNRDQSFPGKNSINAVASAPSALRTACHEPPDDHNNNIKEASI